MPQTERTFFEDVKPGSKEFEDAYRELVRWLAGDLSGGPPQ